MLNFLQYIHVFDESYGLLYFVAPIVVDLKNVIKCIYLLVFCYGDFSNSFELRNLKVMNADMLINIMFLYIFHELLVLWSIARNSGILSWMSQIIGWLQTYLTVYHRLMPTLSLRACTASKAGCSLIIRNILSTILESSKLFYFVSVISPLIWRELRIIFSDFLYLLFI